MLCASSRIISYSTEVHWCWSTHTQTNLDILKEHKIDDYWNVDGERHSSGSCLDKKDLESRRTSSLSTRRRFVDRRQADEDPNYVPTGWNLSRSVVEDVKEILSGKQDGNGIQKNRSWTLHADWAESITLIRMKKNLTTSSETIEENWKRISNHPCRAKRKKTSKRRQCIILCQPNGRRLMTKHSWERPDAPKKGKNQIQFMLTKLVLHEYRRCRISENGKHKHEGHICRPTIQLYESLQFGSYTDTIFRKQYAFRKRRWQWMRRNGANKKKLHLGQNRQ